MDMNVLEVNGSEYDVADAVARENIATLETNVEAQLETKANVDGLYEDLTSGNTLELVSSIKTNDQVPYYYRTTAGNIEAGDRAYINAIVGASAVVNQLVDEIYGSTATINGITFTKTERGYTVSGTNSGTISQKKLVNRMPMQLNHVYAIVGCPKGGSQGTYRMSLWFNNDATGQPRNDYGNGLIIKYTTSYANNNLSLYMDVYGGAVVSNLKYEPVVVDLTSWFGSASVPDYLYTLEQGSAGAGIAKLKSWGFNFSNLLYTANSLQSVSGLSAKKTTGLNQWDEEWEVGSINNSTGANVNTQTDRIRSKNYIPCLAGMNYYFSTLTQASNLWANFFFYDKEKNFISYRGAYSPNSTTNPNNGNPFATPDNACYMRFVVNYTYGNTYKNDINIFIHWDNSYDGVYEPYVEHTYPLDDSITLRGVYKVDSNGNLYADGDKYLPDGSVERRYGIVDLGTLNWTKNANPVYFVTQVIDNIKYNTNSGTLANAICTDYEQVKYTELPNTHKKFTVIWGGSSARGKVYFTNTEYTDVDEFKTAMSGVYLIYELATPTTEEATPYTSPQIVDNWGTEEFITTSPIPIGHNTDYPISLKDKIEAYPNMPSADGVYVMTISGGQASFTELASSAPFTALVARVTALENQ